MQGCRIGGFTLVEVLVAMCVLALGVAGAASTQVAAARLQLTPGERKRHREARTEFSACMKKVAQRWENCRAEAEAKWPK
ncbi:type IV pilus modification PilV family protein [Massilia litorea]|uniref:Prepilin-type N-terminal cleavage/methylation domain-containing protein n=1 Tax=Massilia litorea TaxID=2769491 RepID=A0A7L9U2Z6_9BURK|nr:prepilin-type N-terminal cleavage/methylation domain-containing protein [Massilia litorea]QOL49461.1 prepilin-type N-terminal cleavage/methylation domain-containing protein [Massilia litorea]